MPHRLLLTYVPATPPQAEAPAQAPAKVAVLTLHHEAKRNALDAALCQAIEQALHTAAAEGAQAAVLTGQGPVFCAGSDISSLPEEPDPAWLRGHGPLQSAMYAVSQGPLPVVAALNGPAIGAGCELALSCDLRVAHPEVTLQMPPVRLGLIYTPEGIQRLIALCGLGRTRELLLTARAIDAAEALSWGLLNHVVVAEQVFACALQLAQVLAAQPRLAMAGTRRLIEQLLTASSQLSAEQAAVTLQLRDEAWRSNEARAARSRFRSRPKKPPTTP